MSKTNGFSGPCGFGPDHIEVSPAGAPRGGTARELNSPATSKIAISVGFIPIFPFMENRGRADPLVRLV